MELGTECQCLKGPRKLFNTVAKLPWKIAVQLRWGIFLTLKNLNDVMLKEY